MHYDFWEIWLIMVAIGVGTFLVRFSFLWFFGRGKVRPEIQQALRFVPAAVLSALIVPSFAFSQQGTFSLGNPRLWAGLIAAIVASRSRNILLTIASGLGALWIITLFYAP